jgi:hypothetical protein
VRLQQILIELRILTLEMLNSLQDMILVALENKIQQVSGVEDMLPRSGELKEPFKT